MASGSLPPRQKMINMMYLVLTAILALNVSKEVLDAFAVMDGELVRSERAHEQRSAVEYALFAEAAQRFPEKFKGPHERATRVKAQADSLVELIERVKVNAIAEVDGTSAMALRGKDASGKDTLRALLALENKDDRETLTRMFVGSEPAAPITSPGSAYDLKSRIGMFRDSLKALAKGKDGTEITAALDLLFDLSDRRDASGVLSNWESISFYDVPLAAGVATLSKLQVDIRSSENDVVKWLYSQVDRGDHKFSTLTTAVVPRSSLVMQGDSFKADVFLAAYDPRNRPIVTVGEGTVLQLGADGKAKLHVRGDRIGEHVLSGTIAFEGPDGPEEHPFSTTYQVMAPLLVASPTKMNVLYRGVENPIELSVPGVPSEHVRATITTGSIRRVGAAWVATGMSGGGAEVNAVVDLPGGGTRRIGPVKFRVKDLPAPTAFVGNKSSFDKSIRKVELTANRAVVCKLPDTEFEARFEVLRCNVVVMRGAQPVERVLNSGLFDEGVREAFGRLRKGDRIFIEDIKARLVNSPGTRTYDLAPIAWKVTD